MIFFFFFLVVIKHDYEKKYLVTGASLGWTRILFSHVRLLCRLPHFLEVILTGLREQCKPRSDAAERGV